MGAGVINKGLCVSHPQKERDLSVMISWPPKAFFFFFCTFQAFDQNEKMSSFCNLDFVTLRI